MASTSFQTTFVRSSFLKRDSEGTKSRCGSWAETKLTSQPGSKGKRTQRLQSCTLHCTRSRMASCIRAMAPNRTRKFLNPSSTHQNRFHLDGNSELSLCQIAVGLEFEKRGKTQTKKTIQVTNLSKTPNCLRSGVVGTAARTRS